LYAFAGGAYLEDRADDFRQWDQVFKGHRHVGAVAFCAVCEFFNAVEYAYG
jgi:hypothetical protein